MHTYPGNIHIHSIYSDGSGSISEILTDAAAAGLSYVVISDHETLAGLPQEATVDGVTLLVGSEINRSHSHYLALDIKHLVKSNEENPQLVIDEVRDAGGLGFIAHPFERGSPYIEKGKAYPWKYWPVFGFNGIEIWNYTSHWRGRHPSLFRTLYWFLINRKGALDGPPREALRIWDCYNLHGHRVVGIGSSDAHAFPYNLGLFKVKVFPYRYAFGTINTYVVLDSELSSEHDTAKKQIIGALRDGCCYVSFDSLYPGRDFSFFAVAGKEIVPMGAEIPYQKEISLHVQSPFKRSLIRVLIDGKISGQEIGQELTINSPNPGIYRIEIYYRPRLGRARPWIYSNPIFISKA